MSDLYEPLLEHTARDRQELIARDLFILHATIDRALRKEARKVELDEQHARGAIRWVKP